MPLTRRENHGSGCPWPKPPSRGQQKGLLIVLGKPGYGYTAHTEQNNVLASCSTLSIPSLILTLTELFLVLNSAQDSGLADHTETNLGLRQRVSKASGVAA